MLSDNCSRPRHCGAQNQIVELTDASGLGLAPGDWPSVLYYLDREWTLGHFVFDTRCYDHDLLKVVYMSEGFVLHVAND
jgi:hypothetical protein